MDQELKAYLDAFKALMDERFNRVDDRFTQLEAEVRHTGVLVERLDGNMRLIAEAVVGTNERIDRHQAETASQLHQIKDTFVNTIQRGLVPRVEILEGRVDRANRDILDVVRERLIPRQAQQPR